MARITEGRGDVCESFETDERPRDVDRERRRPLGKVKALSKEPALWRRMVRLTVESDILGEDWDARVAVPGGDEWLEARWDNMLYADVGDVECKLGPGDETDFRRP